MKKVRLLKGDRVTVGGREYTPSYSSIARLVECHLATNPKQRGVNAGDVEMWFNWDGNRDWMAPQYR